MNCYRKGEALRFLVSDIFFKHGLLCAFLLGFLVRFVPELLAYPNFIGFDTVHYAARLKEGIIWHHWSNLFTETWLLYSLLIPIHKITQLDPTITLKIASPILYGLNTTGIYYFANKTLRWKPRKSLVASLLFSFSIAALRITWDLYRNILGLGILLFAVSMMLEIKHLKKPLWFILLSVLTVLGHELTAVSLLFVVALTVLKKMREPNKAEAIRTSALSLPALTIFLLCLYFRIFPIEYEIETNILGVHDTFNPHPLGLFFLTNYLNVSTLVQQYDTYLELSLHIIALFLLMYVLWLPLVLKGFFRDKILDVWILLLLVGSFGPLFIPFCSLLLWSRWMFMLVYPFSFYAANGMEKFCKKPRLKQKIRIAEGFIITTILLGLMFMTLPPSFTPFYTPLTYSYLPSSMQQNTIPLQDQEDAVECLEWLNRNMNQNSCVLVHHAFISWAKLYLDMNHTIVYYAMNSSKALESAQQNGFTEIYIIWWNENISWYPNIEIPENLKLKYSNGRIGIYAY